MNTLVSRFASTSATHDISKARQFSEEEGDEVMWGSSGGFGNLVSGGIPSFTIPNVPNVSFSHLYIPSSTECVIWVYIAK